MLNTSVLINNIRAIIIETLVITSPSDQDVLVDDHIYWCSPSAGVGVRLGPFNIYSITVDHLLTIITITWALLPGFNDQWI